MAHYRNSTSSRAVRKQAKNKADEFASNLIRKHARPGSKGFLDANFVSMELSKLSWNMQGLPKPRSIRLDSTRNTIGVFRPRLQPS